MRQWKKKTWTGRHMTNRDSVLRIDKMIRLLIRIAGGEARWKARSSHFSIPYVESRDFTSFRSWIYRQIRLKFCRGDSRIWISPITFSRFLSRVSKRFPIIRTYDNDWSIQRYKILSLFFTCENFVTLFYTRHRFFCSAKNKSGSWSSLNTKWKN